MIVCIIGGIVLIFIGMYGVKVYKTCNWEFYCAVVYFLFGFILVLRCFVYMCAGLDFLSISRMCGSF